MKKLLSLIAVVLIIISAKAQTYNVSTLAGSINGYANGTGTDAKFTNPSGVCLDANGNLIVTDRNNYLIRKITPAGVVTTIAGTGASGYAEGKPGQFNIPWQSTIDATGNIIVVEKDGARIRKIAPDGTVSTIAGTGVAGFLDGAANTAQFKSALAAAIDSEGNIFVVDRDNRRIRKINTSGQVSTFAGDGTTAILTSPLSITIDADDNLYIGDDKKIKKITKSGVISILAGSSNGFDDGTLEKPLTAKFSDIYGLCFDNEGNLIIADSSPNHSIRKITPGENNNWSKATVSTIAGTGMSGKINGPGAVATFNNPYDVAVDAQGVIYVAEASNHLIRKLTPTTLPVHLSSFTAQKENDKVKLQWATLSEQNSSYFEILKSIDGNNFTPISNIRAKGNSNNIVNYVFIDNNPVNGVNYYQLEQVDFDGRTSLSNTVTVNLDVKGKSKLNVYYNSEEKLLLELGKKLSERSMIKVLTIDGKVIFSASIGVDKETLKIELPLQLQKGIYVVTLNSQGSNDLVKFIVE